MNATITSLIDSLMCWGVGSTGLGYVIISEGNTSTDISTTGNVQDN
jgi:hypothetical protein